jgi:hypothetical protein
MMTPLEITFQLDGAGVFYDAAEPIMLDALLTAALCRWHVSGEPPTRSEQPQEIPIPLSKWHIGDVWGWKASALFPVDSDGQSIVYWRKRLRQNRIEITHGSPNTSNGTYRDWNMPLPLTACTKMVAWAHGDRKEVRRELRRNIKYLGKKRAHGHGRIVDITVEIIEQDWSMSKNGVATRWTPDVNGFRLVRPRPPYWNSFGRVNCCEIGE